MDFKDYLQANNINRYRAYELFIETFFTWIETHKNKPIENTNTADILAYLSYLQEVKNLSKGRVSNTLSAIKKYYNFLVQENKIASNPASNLNLKGVKRKHLVQNLSFTELEEILDNFYTLYVKNEVAEKKKEALCNYIVLSFFIYQGLNQEECIALQIEDIDLLKGKLRIKHSIKKAERIIPLHATQIGVLYEYLYTQNPNTEQPFRILGRRYNFIDELPKLHKKLTHFKQLRTSIIVHWINTEGLRKAQYKAGHKYISSTEKYIANDMESLKNNIQQFHPFS